MKKKLIYLIILIIMVIIVLLLINKQSKQSELVVSNILTNQINRTEIIIQPKQHKTQLFEPEKFSTNNSVFLKNESINLQQLTNIVLSKNDYSYRRKQRIIKEVIPEIFRKNNEIQLTNLINLIIQGAINDSTNIHHPFLDTLCILRFRKLLPYMANKMLKDNNDISKIKDVEMCITWLGHIQHSDTLRTILELDKLIPENSYLRKVTRFGYLPFFYRRDCLDVYIEIVDQPEKYDHDTWYDVAYKIGWFTNDIAISASKRAYKTMKKFKKYWPESPESRFLNVRILKAQMETQKKIINGKSSTRKQPKPLLDE